MEIVLAFLAGFGLLIGGYGFWRMRQWEKQLAGARIAIYYKRRSKLQAPLIEWLHWANMLHNDKQSNGRSVYHMGQTTVVITKPGVGPAAETKTRTVKQKRAA